MPGTCEVFPAIFVRGVPLFYLFQDSSFFAYLAHAARWLMILLMRAQTSRLGTRPLRSAKTKVGSSMTTRPNLDGAIWFSRRNVSISSRNSAEVCIGNFLHQGWALVKQKTPALLERGVAREEFSR